MWVRQGQVRQGCVISLVPQLGFGQRWGGGGETARKGRSIHCVLKTPPFLLWSAGRSGIDGRGVGCSEGVGQRQCSRHEGMGHRCSCRHPAHWPGCSRTRRSCRRHSRSSCQQSRSSCRPVPPGAAGPGQPAAPPGSAPRHPKSTCCAWVLCALCERVQPDLGGPGWIAQGDTAVRGQRIRSASCPRLPKGAQKRWLAAEAKRIGGDHPTPTAQRATQTAL